MLTIDARKTSYGRGLTLCGLWLLWLVLSPGIARAEDGGVSIQDVDITNAVMSQLLVSKRVAAHRIDVETHEGIVELSGMVDNLLAKRYAKREAETIKGVRAVVNRLQVQTSNLADQQIASNVLNALAADPATDTWEISVNVQGGVATLTGTVDSYAERDLAEEVAAGAKGVTGVDVELEVTYKTTRSDAEIERDIEGRLASSSLIDEGMIDVLVRHAKATLSGSVGSAAEKELARSKAWVAGVKRVDTDGLDVKWWLRDEMQRTSSYANLSDEQIQETVRDALGYDPRVASFDVAVSVLQGSVTLTGVVNNLKAKRAAEQDARNTKGVWQVNNHIRVRGFHTRSDEEVLADVRSALRSDVVVDRYEIATTVYGGHVYLHGTVDSAFEKQRAEDVASGVDAVVTVRNFLKVDEDYEFPNHDVELKADIEYQFWWDPYINEEQIAVTVVDGIATLSGTVDNWTEWAAARDDALKAGAQRVVNQLEVK